MPGRAGPWEPPALPGCRRLKPSPWLWNPPTFEGQRRGPYTFGTSFEAEPPAPNTRPANPLRVCLVTHSQPGLGWGGCSRDTQSTGGLPTRGTRPAGLLPTAPSTKAILWATGPAGVWPLGCPWSASPPQRPHSSGPPGRCCRLRLRTQPGPALTFIQFPAGQPPQQACAPSPGSPETLGASRIDSCPTPHRLLCQDTGAPGAPQPFPPEGVRGWAGLPAEAGPGDPRLAGGPEVGDRR